MNEICVFCLSKDRNLNSMGKIDWFNCFPYISIEDSQYMLYLQNESLLQVCFECKARIDNVHKFVQRSVQSLRILKEFWASTIEVNIAIINLLRLGPRPTQLGSKRQAQKTPPVPRSRLSNSIVDIHDTVEAFAQSKSDDEEKDVFKHVVKVEFDNHPQPCAGRRLSRKLSTSIKYEEVDESSFVDETYIDHSDSDVQKTKKECRKKKSSKRLKSSPAPAAPAPAPATPSWSSLWLTTDQARERFVAERARDEAKRKRDEAKRDKAKRDDEAKRDVACPLCRHAFVDETELAEHSSACHDEKIGEHTCDICLYRFESEQKLKVHSDTHHVLFKCAQCDYETARLSRMESHAEGHLFDSGDEVPLNQCRDARRCKKCKAEFGDTTDLKRHQAKCSQFKCDYCDKVFGHRTSKYSHMDLHHKPQEKVSCKHCDKTFKNKYAIKSHLLKHRRERSGNAYSCSECSQDFRTALAYKQHYYKTVRDRPCSHVCTHCPASFAAAAELERHVAAAHLAAGVFKCDRCHKWFIHKRALQLHAAREHERGARAAPPRDKICDVCGKGFTSSTILRNHQRAHTGERPFACALCPAAFAHSGSLYTHTRLVHKKRRRKDAQLDAQLFPCPVCAKEFTSEPSMRVHYEFFHLKKSKFVCELCNKMFISAWNLKNHKKMLHGVNRTRSYPCTTCGREFFRVDALKSHKLIHSEDRTFMCSECGKTFKQQAALYTHNKLVHKGLKRPSAKSCKKTKFVGAE